MPYQISDITGVRNSQIDGANLSVPQAAEYHNGICGGKAGKRQRENKIVIREMVGTNQSDKLNTQLVFWFFKAVFIKPAWYFQKLINFILILERL